MTQLKRTLGPVSLTLYGIGVTLGAGIYVLIGETAGFAGSWMPVSFLIALSAAFMTSLSYAELGGRYPVSAGEAVFMQEAFGKPWLSQGVGIAVTFTGLFSSATILQGFSGYAMTLSGMPQAMLIILATLILTGLALWGVKASVWAASAITIMEIGGILAIIVLAAPKAITDPVPFVSAAPMGILVAASVAFFAFIGFEDIVNMSEETRNPERNVPRAVIATMLITGVIYILIAVIASRAVSPADLAASPAPMAEILRQTGYGEGEIVSLVAMVAILNGALVNILMASRVLFGMAKKGLAPAFLAQVNRARQTPHMATLVVAAAIMILALAFPLSSLARVTSFGTLIVFLLVNLALIVLRRKPFAPAITETFRAPGWTPYLGVLATATLALTALFG